MVKTMLIAYYAKVTSLLNLWALVALALVRQAFWAQLCLDVYLWKRKLQLELDELRAGRELELDELRSQKGARV